MVNPLIFMFHKDNSQKAKVTLSSLLTLLALSCQFPELCILDERVVRIQPRENQTGHTVPPSGPADVHFGESEAGMGHELVRPKPPTLLDHSASHQVRIPVHLRQVVIDIPKRVLQDVRLEIPDPSVHLKPFVNQFFAIAQTALSKELRLAIIRIPAAMADP